MTAYLDFNATTPIDPDVLTEMINVYQNHPGNAGSRTHIYGQKANEIVIKARTTVASILNIDKSEVIFTSGATESNNITLFGLARWGEQHGRKHIISTQIEHKSILEPLQYLSKQGFEVDFVGVSASGRVDPDTILKRVRPDTLLVTVMHANNETGVIQPIDIIGEALSSTETYFHVDAAQTFGKLVPELQTLKYDTLSISGHKIYGPQGIGALMTRRRNYQRPPLQPITFGGGQEGNLRPGTLPVALIAGLGKASEIASREYQNWLNQNNSIKQSLLEQLKGIEYVINGDQEYCLSHTLNISFPSVDSEALMLATRNSIAISNGSACTSHDYKPSHVLTAMGLSEELVEGAIRISWGKISQIDFCDIIKGIKKLT